LFAAVEGLSHPLRKFVRMAKARVEFRCGECGTAAPQWAGKCPGCGAWNTLHEERIVATSVAPIPLLQPAVPVADVDMAEWEARPTGVAELDRVLAGGLVPGSVTVLGGEPGIGKSTLLTQVAAAMANAGGRVLYVAAEESSQQVRLRAERLDAVAPRLWLAAETNLPHVVAHLDAVKPDVVIVDSIQTVHDPELGSAPGSVVQVRECAYRLVREAKERGVAIVLVGHVTKDGNLAGPRVLEHVVDTVLAFEGDQHHALRIVRAVKHRFGSTNEVGLFEMTDAGLVEVPDASALFLADRRAGIAGSVVAPALDGHRPLLVEVQGLAVPTGQSIARRSAEGLDVGRVAFLLAVLERHAGCTTSKHDVFALAVGGVSVHEPGADLAIALAVVSSLVDRALGDDVVACAEVGLGGELRQVSQTPRRLAEAARLGFRHVVLPHSAPEPPAGLTAMRAGTIKEAITLTGLAQ
jgi:DNA repair protein RadA/Sms